VLPFEEARKRGAVALFTEEYGETVRMVSVDDFSMELCGGTHLRNTVEAGLFKITSETGIASGVRRIEGVTGYSTYKWMRDMENLVQEMEFLLDIDRKNLPKRVEKTLALLKEQKKQIEKMESQAADTRVEELLNKTSKIGSYNYVAAEIEGGKDSLRKISGKLREEMPEGVGLLTSTIGPSVFVLIFVGEKLKEKLNASELIRKVCKIIDGGGGGSRVRAEGGGNAVKKVPKMLKEFAEILKKELK
jgi:alanyl-tRNA synthetase